MLVLSRKKDESVMIGDSFQVKILEIQKGQVKIGIEAPRDVTVHRMEVYLAIQEENVAATQAAATDMSAVGDLFKGKGLAAGAVQPGTFKSKGKPRTKTKGQAKKKR